jgi:uncharacterized protein YjeT (DUF2065 family)
MSEEQPTTIPVERKRGRETALDMLRSMGVLAVFVGFILLITWRPLPDSTGIKPVDAFSAAKAAQSRAEFPLLLMVMPSGWNATSARLEKAPNDNTKHVWHIGYVTDTDNYLAVEQTDTALREAFIKANTNGPKESNPIRLESTSWSVYPATNAVVFVYEGPEYLVLVRADERMDATKALVALDKVVATF